MYGDTKPGNPVGALHTTMHDSTGNEIGHVSMGFNGDNVAHITDTGIDGGYMGRGYGRKMYVEAIEKAKQHGATSITSDTAVSPEAERVWRSLAKDYPVIETNRNGKPYFTIPLKGKP